MPVEATVLPDGNYYLPATDETIPADMATPSPDDRFHHCVDSAVFPLGFDRGGPVWAKLELDASLLRCIPRSARCPGG
jgi:hypothetical protein